MSPQTIALPTSWRKETIKSHYEDVERVISEMEKCLTDGLSLNELADVAVMTPFHFNRVFRCVTGVPPCRFMWMLRLEAAKKLLATTDRKVIDVCYDVGYNSLGTFTRRFTQLVGIPPLRFRRMATNGAMDQVTSIVGNSPKDDPQDFETAAPSGVLSCPESFDGLVSIGLFKSPVYNESPICFTLAKPNEGFQFGRIPNGKFYMFAAGIKKSTDALDSLLSERMYRGSGHDGAVEVHNELCNQVNRITLRPPRLTDPPLLPCLPEAILQRAGRSADRQSAL